MNSIELNTSSAVTYAKQNNVQPVNVQTTDVSTDSRLNIKEDVAKSAPVLEDVIAVSEDGDTLQASKAAIEATNNLDEAEDSAEKSGVTWTADEEEKIYIAENDIKPEQETVTTNLLSENDKREAQEISSLSGYSKQQIEQLYLDGRISRYAYDQNMQAREERLEEMNTSTQSEEEVKERLSAQEAFAKEMGQLIARSANITNTDKGIIDAINNNRADLVGDIFMQ